MSAKDRNLCISDRKLTILPKYSTRKGGYSRADDRKKLHKTRAFFMTSVGLAGYVTVLSRQSKKDSHDRQRMERDTLIINRKNYSVGGPRRTFFSRKCSENPELHEKSVWKAKNADERIDKWREMGYNKPESPVVSGQVYPFDGLNRILKTQGKGREALDRTGVVLTGGMAVRGFTSARPWPGGGPLAIEAVAATGSPDMGGTKIPAASKHALPEGRKDSG